MNEEGYRVITKNSDSFYKWETFKEYIKLDEYIFLCENPKRCIVFCSKFYSAQEWAQLSIWIRMKVNHKEKELDLRSLDKRYKFKK